jgi:hypothetical protein
VPKPDGGGCLKSWKPLIRRNFEKEIDGLGWKITFIPSEQIEDYSDFIDRLR